MKLKISLVKCKCCDLDRWMDGWKDEQMDGRIDGWMDGLDWQNLWQEHNQSLQGGTGCMLLKDKCASQMAFCISEVA